MDAEHPQCNENLCFEIVTLIGGSINLWNNFSSIWKSSKFSSSFLNIKQLFLSVK